MRVSHPVLVAKMEERQLTFEPEAYDCAGRFVGN